MARRRRRPIEYATAGGKVSYETAVQEDTGARRRLRALIAPCIHDTRNYSGLLCYVKYTPETLIRIAWAIKGWRAKRLELRQLKMWLD